MDFLIGDALSDYARGVSGRGLGLLMCGTSET